MSRSDCTGARGDAGWAAIALTAPARVPAGTIGLIVASCLVLSRPAAAQDAAAPDAGSQAAAVQDAAPPLPAPSDTVLPRTGIDPTAPDLRDRLLRSYGESAPLQAPNGPNLHINGQFGVSEEYTTNVGQNAGGGSGRGSDFITLLQPAITIVDTTQRLQIDLDYRPTGEVYAKHGDFSQFEQQFDGSIVATALPGWIYVDLRGSVSQQAVYGGLGAGSTVTLAPDNRQTTSSVSISPYVSHALGGGQGSVQLGAGYTYSATDAPNQTGVVNPLLLGNGTYGSFYLATKRVFASYTTGENLGRLRNRVDTDDSFYDGSGALAGGRRILATDDASYAVTRLVTVLGQVGYEDLSYPRSAFSYSGPVGAGGVRLTPNRNSSLTVEYRYTDGFGSAYVQGSVQVTPRIRVFGGYSAGISTFQQDVQNTLLDGAENATGVVASALQAAPLLGASSAFSANQNLNRERRLDASATYIGDKDTVTVSVQQERTTPVGRQVGTIAPVSTNGVFGSVTELHQLTPVLSLSAYVQYGSNRNGLGRFRGGAESGDTVSFSVGVDRTFTETITGYARVGGTYVVGGSAFAATGPQGLGDSETTFLVGALKRF